MTTTASNALFCLLTSSACLCGNPSPQIIQQIDDGEFSQLPTEWYDDFYNSILIDNLSLRLNPFTEIIDQIASLSDNWDTYGAIAIPMQTCDNCRKFIKVIMQGGASRFLDADDISPTTYGTVLFEFTSMKGKVVVEIGFTQIAYFTLYKNNKDFCSENIDTDFESLPEGIVNAIKVLS